MTVTGQEITIAHFTDERVAAVGVEGSPLTADEREFLITSLPRFEECSDSEAQLRAKTDPELMQAAYFVWADYAGNQS